VMMVWTDEFRVMPQTFAGVFPRVRLFDFFMIGSRDQMSTNAERRRRLVAAHPPETQTAIAHYDGAYVGDESLVREQKWPVNTDARPVAEYFLGHVYRGWTSRPWTMRSWVQGR